MNKPEKLPHIPKDLFDREIQIDDFVAYASNSLYIGKVIKITPKMIRVKHLSKWGSEKLVYSQDCIKVREEEITMYLLKNKRT